MQYSIRQAKAEDLSTLARLVYIAGEAHLNESIYDVMFPGPIEHKLETIENLLNSWSWFHFSTFLVAEKEGKIAAAISGYSMAERGGPGLKDALTEIGWSPRDSWDVVARITPLLRVEPEHFKDAFVIEHAACFEEVGEDCPIDILIGAMIRKARESECAIAEFTFFSGDKKVQEAAESYGFKIKDSFTDGAFKKLYGSPGMIRMTIDL